MITKRLRILIARFGDGYENAMHKLAESCCLAGFQVVYTEVQDPAAIVACALQESVDHIGITTLPGARIESFAELFELLAREDLTHVRVTAGGFLAEEDVAKIKAMGVVEFYPRGAIYKKIEQWTAEYAEVPNPPDCSQVRNVTPP